MAEHVLITTDDLEPAVRIRDALQREDVAVELLTPTEKIADIEDPVLLILTGKLEQKRARRLLREAAEHDNLPVIGLADSPAQAEPKARRALGLVDVFEKPVDPEDVALVSLRLIERTQLRRMTGIIGRTEAMEEVLERITQIAPVASTVLVTGESGTGKELVARGIHGLSPRRHRAFIAANVAALPESLLESELFGHEKGSFTGAVAQRKGFFELADEGTLFLDEIGEMPLTTQTKLLRVLEQHEFMRVGGETSIRVDARVIAATNQPLRQRVQMGDFRRDLYYRLNVLSIHLPPLREREDDIPLLIDHFIRETSREHELPPVVISREALGLLMRYSWPGNVRELKNLIESMQVLKAGQAVQPDDLPEQIHTGGRPEPALPVHIPSTEPGEDDDAPPPAMEFMFRMMLQLRMDVEDLRREFDRYRERHGALLGPVPVEYPYSFLEEGPVRPPVASGAGGGAGTEGEAQPDAGPDTAAAGEAEVPEGAVVYRPGMTMRDVERETITAALEEVGGNRRQAAEMLGIGERTLYRKIKEYEIPL